VSFASGQIDLSYTSSTGSGTLSVVSGPTLTPVAQINMIGTYTSANFSARADSNGNVEIFDPAVVDGGSVASGPAQTFPRHGVGLLNMVFDAHATLAYAENNTDAGGTLTLATATMPGVSRFSSTTWPEALSQSPTAVRWSPKRKAKGSHCWHTRCTGDDSRLGAPKGATSRVNAQLRLRSSTHNEQPLPQGDGSLGGE
jgi:hypothetical protein